MRRKFSSRLSVLFKRAQTLDPVSGIIKSTEGSLLYFARLYDQAIKQLLR